MKITTTGIWSILHNYNSRISTDSADAEYWRPRRKEVVELVKASRIDLKQYIGSIGDCDKYALVLHSQVVLARWGLVLAGVAAEGDEGHLPWAFGQMTGIFKKVSTVGRHRLNFCITSDEGLLLIEPQTDEIWHPVKGEDILEFAAY